MVDFKRIFLTLASLLFMCNSYATTSVEIFSVNSDGKAKSIGTVSFTDSKWGGLLIEPNLTSLTPGAHGFHVHEHPDCSDKAMAAGGHMDPDKTGKHLGPYNDGHLGDLPVLLVNEDGSATLTLYAPRLSEKQIKDHALMIHQGGDNYSDQPEKLGGGGKRVACGVIKSN